MYGKRERWVWWMKIKQRLPKRKGRQREIIGTIEDNKSAHTLMCAYQLFYTNHIE